MICIHLNSKEQWQKARVGDDKPVAVFYTVVNTHVVDEETGAPKQKKVMGGHEQERLEMVSAVAMIFANGAELVVMHPQITPEELLKEFPKASEVADISVRS